MAPLEGQKEPGTGFCGDTEGVCHDAPAPATP